MATPTIGQIVLYRSPTMVGPAIVTGTHERDEKRLHLTVFAPVSTPEFRYSVAPMRVDSWHGWEPLR